MNANINIDLVRQARREGCRRCAFWTGMGLQKNSGQCRISPPRTSSELQWPVTMSHAFCGSWLPVDDTEAPE